jgi:hypothetical protein
MKNKQTINVALLRRELILSALKHKPCSFNECLIIDYVHALERYILEPCENMNTEKIKKD